MSDSRTLSMMEYEDWRPQPQRCYICGSADGVAYHQHSSEELKRINPRFYEQIRRAQLAP